MDGWICLDGWVGMFGMGSYGQHKWVDHANITCMSFLAQQPQVDVLVVSIPLCIMY